MKTHTIKPGDRVTLNFAALSSGNAAYLRLRVGDIGGTVLRVRSGFVRVAWDNGYESNLTPGQLAPAVQQGDLFA